MNKFTGLPFERCWECKNMENKVQAVNDPNSKVKQGNYYECKKYGNTLDVAWKKCCGKAFRGNTMDEQGEMEVADKEQFDPNRRGQQLFEMSWNNVRQLSKSYGIALRVKHGGERDNEEEAQKARWMTKMDLVKAILKYEAGVHNSKDGDPLPVVSPAPPPEPPHEDNIPKTPEPSPDFSEGIEKPNKSSNAKSPGDSKS